MSDIDVSVSFFFNDTATTEIYTLSLHDALPISTPILKPIIEHNHHEFRSITGGYVYHGKRLKELQGADRKSTRLNSSHGYISYAVFCLKKKKKQKSDHKIRCVTPTTIGSALVRS